MISKKLTKNLNEQINKEMYSAYLYLSMAAYATNAGLTGTGKWLRLQAEEEMEHAGKIYDYINDQGERVVLSAIAEPPKDFKGVLDIFKKTLDHEKKVTKSIHNLVTQAKQEKDYATEAFLQWFVKEQVEEEATAADILQKLEIAGDKGPSLLMLDVHLGKRAKS